MKTRRIELVRTVAGDGWRGWDRLSDRECRRIGVPRGSIVNPRDPYYVIYSPARNGGYDNTYVRAGSLDRHRPERGA